MLSRKKPLNPKGKVILRKEAMQTVTKAKNVGLIVDQILNFKDCISVILVLL